MTVKELIAELQNMPSEVQVVTSSAPMLPIEHVEWGNDEWANQYRGKVVLSPGGGGSRR